MELVRSSACDSSACLEYGYDEVLNLVVLYNSRSGRNLTCTPAEWDAFALGVRNNEFHTPWRKNDSVPAEPVVS